MESLIPNSYIEFIIRVVATVVVGIFINKLLSFFRKRQLYVTSNDELEGVPTGIEYFSLNIEIFNVGKEKEEEVIVKIPSAKKITLVSSSYDDCEVVGNEIKVDRVLSKSSVKMNLLIEGPSLSDLDCKKSKRIKVKSKDADGKYKEGLRDAPVSRTEITFIASFAIAISTVFIAPLFLNTNPISMVKNYYYQKNYKDFLDGGFYFSYGRDENGALEFYKKRGYPEGPVKFINAKIEDNDLKISFLAKNITKERMGISFSFKNSKMSEYIDEVNRAELMNKVEGKEYQPAILDQSLKDKYQVYSLNYKDSNKSLSPKTEQLITLSRPLKKGLSLDDLVIDLTIKVIVEDEVIREDIDFDLRKTKDLDKDLMENIKNEIVLQE